MTPTVVPVPIPRELKLDATPVRAKLRALSVSPFPQRPEQFAGLLCRRGEQPRIVEERGLILRAGIHLKSSADLVVEASSFKDPM
jgi:hypothetical protein